MITGGLGYTRPSAAALPPLLIFTPSHLSPFFCIFSFLLRSGGEQGPGLIISLPPGLKPTLQIISSFHREPDKPFRALAAEEDKKIETNDWRCLFVIGFLFYLLLPGGQGFGMVFVLLFCYLFFSYSHQLFSSATNHPVRFRLVISLSLFGKSDVMVCILFPSLCLCSLLFLLLFGPASFNNYFMTRRTDCRI